jgi:hypothetical protein
LEGAGWYHGLVSFVTYYFCVATLLLWGLGWVEGLTWMAVGGGAGFTGVSSVGVVASAYIMVMFTAFVVCRVVSATRHISQACPSALCNLTTRCSHVGPVFQQSSLFIEG